jgi:hypothetical protein
MVISLKNHPRTPEELKHLADQLKKSLESDGAIYTKELAQRDGILDEFNRVNPQSDDLEVYAMQFRLSNILKAFGLKKNFVLNLVSMGIVRPFKDVEGRGGTRIYSFWNLVQFVLFSHLTKLGISYSQAKSVLESLEEFLLGEIQYLRLVLHIVIAGLIDGENKIGFVTYDSQNGFDELPGLTLDRFIDQLVLKGITPKRISFFYILNVKSIVQYVVERIKDL